MNLILMPAYRLAMLRAKQKRDEGRHDRAALYSSVAIWLKDEIGKPLSPEELALVVGGKPVETVERVS